MSCYIERLALHAHTRAAYLCRIGFCHSPSCMEITSHIHHISQVFASGRTFYIDFYQREYKWEQEQVEVLLNDVFYRFNLEYPGLRHLEPNAANASRYSSYYLNTYITTVTPSNGRTYVVDGQQRLTTLTLILLKLYHAHQQYGLGTDWLKGMIAGAGPDGYTFWMGSGKRAAVLQSLFEQSPPEVAKGNVTGHKMVDNYAIISDYLDQQLAEEDMTEAVRRLRMFGLYFGLRLFLTNLVIGQADVPMVFEALNDRGMSLLPHEILKGKLLGQLDKLEVEQYADQWEQIITRLEQQGKGEPDRFLRQYLRARFAATREKAEQDFSEATYHRAVLQDEYNHTLHFRHDVGHLNLPYLRHFIKEELPYYARLYQEINTDYPAEDGAGCRRYVCLNKQKRYLLVLGLAVCDLHDPAEAEKLAALARELDRYYALAMLNQQHSDDQFTSVVYRLRDALRGQPASAYRAAFDAELFRFAGSPTPEQPADLLPYRHFSRLGYDTLNKRFIRYLFARVEYLLAGHLGYDMPNWYYLVDNTGYLNGHHIEHILADNEENRQLFDNDEQRFYQARNRLGGLLLLRGSYNLASNNETYDQKLITYQGTLLWNQSLTDGFYHAKPQHKKFATVTGLALQKEAVFDEGALERRSQLLHRMVKHIWA